MKDLISRQAAIEHLKKRLYETELNSDAKYPYYAEMADNRVSVWLDEVPTVDDVPDRNVRKWIYPTDIDGFGRCENCKALWDVSLIRNKFFKHCPRCGHPMERGAER